jgi:integrase/recombinase XerD
MKSLSQAVSDYLELRRGLGFKLVVDERHLRKFIAFLEARNTAHVTTQLALEFATLPKNVDPGWWVQRFGAVRAFALYWQGFDPHSEVPPAGLLRCPAKRARPRFLSELQLVQVMELARGMSSSGTHGLRPWTLYTLFGLLAVTGMRISEALHLQGHDIDWDTGVLTVHKTKFGKSRLVPLHPSTVQALAAYARRRERYFAGASSPPCGHFFVSNRGTALSDGNIRGGFGALLLQAGLLPSEHGGGPRLHDLRHRFAVETLRGWYQAGEPVEQRLPALSTYLGHVNVAATYWYLSCTPELQAAASARVEARWEGVAP